MAEPNAEHGRRWPNDCGHTLTSFYAIKPADPHGEAVFGEHFGCQECDEQSDSSGLS